MSRCIEHVVQQQNSIDKLQKSPERGRRRERFHCGLTESGRAVGIKRAKDLQVPLPQSNRQSLLRFLMNHDC